MVLLMRTLDGVTLPETLPEILAPGRTALLVIDVQNDFAHPDGHFPRAGTDLTLIASRLPAMRRLIAGVRAAGAPVVHIHQSTLPDGASDSPAWLAFKTRSGRRPDYTLPGSWGAAALDGFEPAPGEPVVVKFRPDGFLGTGLEGLLRDRGIERLIVCGLFTEGCVESTVRAGSYRDFFVVVAGDAVASAVPELHEGSLRLMAARYPVRTADEILGALDQGRA